MSDNMGLYNLSYPCKCGTRYTITVDGTSTVTADTWAQECPTCGNRVELGAVSSAVVRA